MPRRSKNAAVAAMETVIENHVAGRIRLRRGLLGMSQSDLAKALGITFQQVQKYERGSNRVSVGKLYRLADILDVPLTFFFDGLDVPDMRRPPETFAATAEGSSPILSRRELDLLRAWKTAPEEIADAVGSLLRAISPNAGYDEEAVAAARAAATQQVPPPAAVTSAPAAAAATVEELPAPRRRGPVPGSKRTGTAATRTAAANKVTDGRRRRGAIWDPADIRDYSGEKE
ncbi:helix-turn-helix domain-containing protein [Niveispirillum sp. SYP-B3756]|uniref:helix-turn-helix domain-containing protein n=1 Tax=Niveispirillum sp. SYP-B3756 TaxID=2662178 RepID=UPI0012910083|nr:helix-turn-helix domain-containing protein [Niveispirillum sp. SYP-B3756]MQP66233.1 helix-turn-helix domain-containing protein [Niveispirillum sp. SYP-B3756]